MKIYFKTAGRDEEQDYLWYELKDGHISKVDEEQFSSIEMLHFLYKSENELDKLLISTNDTNRKDKWDRSIRNTWYFEDDASENMIKHLAQSYLLDRESTELSLNEIIYEDDHEFGFGFNDEELYEITPVIFEKRHNLHQRFFELNDYVDQKALATLITEQDDLVIVNVDTIYDFDINPEVHYISETVKHLKNEYQKKKKEDRKKKIIGGTVAALAVIGTAIGLNSLNKKGKN